MSTVIVNEKEMWKYIGKRKHHLQMTKNERDGLVRRLKGVQKWKIANHALERLEEKGIEATYEDIVSTIYNSTLIEYRIVHNRIADKCEERVVIRSKAVVNRCYNLKVVFSLTTQTIVTVWINHVSDHHGTLNWRIYDKNMKVFGV